MLIFKWFHLVTDWFQGSQILQAFLYPYHQAQFQAMLKHNHSLHTVSPNPINWNFWFLVSCIKATEPWYYQKILTIRLNMEAGIATKILRQAKFHRKSSCSNLLCKTRYDKKILSLKDTSKPSQLLVFKNSENLRFAKNIDYYSFCDQN